MMDVLPPKWTELFQHQQEQEIVEQQKDHKENKHSHGPCQWRNPIHYNTYQACTIHSTHDYHQHLPNSPRNCRAQSYSSNPLTMEPMSFAENESETQLHGTRFRLTKATIRIDDEDEEQQHEQFHTEHHYV